MGVGGFRSTTRKIKKDFFPQSLKFFVILASSTLSDHFLRTFDFFGEKNFHGFFRSSTPPSLPMKKIFSKVPKTDRIQERIMRGFQSSLYLSWKTNLRVPRVRSKSEKWPNFACKKFNPRKVPQDLIWEGNKKTNGCRGRRDLQNEWSNCLSPMSRS